MKKRVVETPEKGEEKKVEPQYVKRIRNVMSDKYRLSDKFEMISRCLAPATADDDLRDFEKAKKLRDKMTHGDDVQESTLPVSIVQELIRKYLNLHLADAEHKHPAKPSSKSVGQHLEQA